jgi:uncharacterized protein (TIGR03083 family)
MAIDYTGHLRSNGEKMALAATRDLDAHVPTCPDWNVAKLTIHTGQHHRWVADAVRRGGDPPESPPKPGLRGSALVEWFRQGWHDLADLLDGSDDETPAWSWAGDNRVGFWRRRTALETLVHRWDAENAVGTASGLDPELAADGIDEMLFVMMPNGGAYGGEPLKVALETTDAPAAWTLQLEPGEPIRAGRGAGRGSVSVAGSAENLLLFLWGRYGPQAVEISGDPEHVAALLAWMSD